MAIDKKTIISVTDDNKNFSKTTKIVDVCGQDIVLKENKQKNSLDQNLQIGTIQEERIEYLGRKILKEHINAFKELAK